jgi:D-serine deaminase-like pyridoxal phosphate-dependent protein
MAKLRIKETAHDLSRDEFGEPGSLRRIRTPALVCDIDALMSNIAHMASLARSVGVALRPHVKSHKTAFIAKCQLEAGAVGLSCAKLSEAEALIDRFNLSESESEISILLTSPIAGELNARRAAALAQLCKLIVVVDHLDGVKELDAALHVVDATLEVLCDVDVGLARTGVRGANEAIAIVERLAACPQLRFAGVQGYAGHVQHIAGSEHRRQANTLSMNALIQIIESLELHGHPVALRTGGGTGTSSMDVEFGLLNELQVGSYVFMDREYRDALAGDREGEFRQSLTIATTVISANHERFVTVDAGLKAMATDAGAPTIVGYEGEATYQFFGDEHGRVTNGPRVRFQRGERLALVPPHCDPTVDKYDRIWLVRGDVVFDEIDVTARGCSQ